MTTANICLPRLPSREELLAWLTAADTKAPAKLSLDRRDPTAPLAPDLVGEFLRQKYGFKAVDTDGWYILKGHYNGGTMVFDADSSPHAIGYFKAIVRAADVIATRRPDDPYLVVTREEAALILQRYENPHDAADAIVHARELAS